MQKLKPQLKSQLKPELTPQFESSSLDWEEQDGQGRQDKQKEQKTQNGVFSALEAQCAGNLNSPLSNPDFNNKASLQRAFDEFNACAEQLDSTNKILTERIETLTRELALQDNSAISQNATPQTALPIDNLSPIENPPEIADLSEKESQDKTDSRLSHLLSALPAGVLVIDNRGTIQEANPAAIDLLGEPLVDELWRHVIDRSIEPSITGGQESRLKDGRTVSMSTCPLGNEPGQIILLMDVTETRFLQQSLERHQRLSAMGEMSAKVAHQIRTPLASALLYVSNMNKNNLAEVDRTRFLAKALSRLQHMENVVEDMLSFSRVGELGQDIVALTDIIDELQMAMETHLESAGCVLRIENVQADIAICANRDALLGVLQNLVSNAIQVTGQGGEFILSIQSVDRHHGIPSVDIKLIDNGPGISEGNLEKIFDPFFTTRAQGTGLGLSVAKAVVENHGGSIWVDETSEKGTTFIIRLAMVKSSDLNGLHVKS